MTNSSIHDTARTMLAVLHGIRDLGGGHYLSSTFSAETREVLIHLAAKIPDLIVTWKSDTVPDGLANGIGIETPDGLADLSFQMVAPHCYTMPGPRRFAADRDAYHELVRLASEDSIVDFRGRKRTVPADIHVGRRALSPPMDPAFGGTGSPDQRHALALRTVMQREASLLRRTSAEDFYDVTRGVAVRLIAACDGAEDRAPDERQAVPTIVEDSAAEKLARCPCGKVGCVDPRPLASIGGQPLVHDGPDLESSIPGRW